MWLLDTEFLNSLREDLTAAGIPKKPELSASSGYLVKMSSSVEVQRQDFTENAMDIDSIDIDPMEMDEDDEHPESELPAPEYWRCNYESHQEMFKLSSPFGERSSTPMVKVSQKIGGNHPLPTIASDGSYTNGDDDEEFGALGGSMIVPDLVFPNRGKSLAFGDDERLAEQVRLAATSYE